MQLTKMPTLSLPPLGRGQTSDRQIRLLRPYQFVSLYELCHFQVYASATVADERKPAVGEVIQLQSRARAIKSHRKRLQAKTTYICES